MYFMYYCTLYKCVVFFTVNHATVAVPTVRIDGGDPEMYVESGSSVVLRCHISDWLQKPQIVFWYETMVDIFR